MYKKLLIFDLDGTVIDSSDAITSTFQDTLKQYGVEEPNKKILQSFIGPTLISTYSTHYGFSGNILEKVLATHKQIFKKNGIKKNYVYPGMHNFLSQMHTNVKFAVATTKYTEDALAILRSTNLSMFDYVQGADDTMIDNDKTNLIQKVISHYSPINKENIVMGS